jgi:RNA polymerase sigma factor for flagellar operon FliA
MNGDDREARIRALLPLVKQLARRVHRMLPRIELDDLVGDGSVGLIRAVDAYDPALGIPLPLYARRVVLGAMLNGVRRLDPVSERVRRTMRLGERACDALAQELGATPSAAAVDERVPGLARARVEAYRGTPLSLDAALPPGERLAPAACNDPALVVEAHAERLRLHAAIAALPGRHRRIVCAHYYAGRSLRSLHGDLGVSAQRVSQLHLRAVQRLRAQLEAAP